MTSFLRSEILQTDYFTGTRKKTTNIRNPPQKKEKNNHTHKHLWNPMRGRGSLVSDNGNWFLVLGAGNLFATKWVHVKRYSLKIGGASFWRDSVPFFYIKNHENHEATTKIIWFWIFGISPKQCPLAILAEATLASAGWQTEVLGSSWASLGDHNAKAKIESC